MDWFSRYVLAWELDHTLLDNIFTERLWRTVKYQEGYLNDYQSPREARQRLSQFLQKYNNYRPHQSLKYLTPQEMEKITAKVLKISIQDVKKYQQEGVGLGQLIAASVIDKKSNLTFQQVLDPRKSGKTFYQIAQEKNISWQDYR